MTEFDGAMHEDYPAQRRLVVAAASHGITIDRVRTKQDVMRIRLSIEDARRLTDALKEIHARR